MGKLSEGLQSALTMTGLVQPVSSNQKGGWLEVLCRQIPGQEKPWIAAVEHLLEVADTHGLNEALILARRYLRRDGRMVFGWYISIGLKNSKELSVATDRLVKALESFRPTLQAPAKPVAQPTMEPVVQPPAPKKREIAAMTTASPRPPGPGKDPVVPNGQVSRGTIISRGSDGRSEVLEIQLPHVYKDLNVPKDGSQKGARKMG